MGDIHADMADDADAQQVVCDYIVGETVEFFKSKWKPFKVISINNVIISFDSSIKKYNDESFVPALQGGFDFYVVIKRKDKKYKVLQNSKRLAHTNTHIHIGSKYYQNMIDMMNTEPRRIKNHRRRRERRRIIIVSSIDNAVRERTGYSGDTLPIRAHISQYVRPGTTLNHKLIKPSKDIKK